MKRVLVFLFSFLFSVLSFFLAVPAAGQSWQQNLATCVETPAVTGYEQALAAEIRSRLAKFLPQTDNLGNVYVTLGKGSPHRLIVAPMDEPGYVVSGITPEGYLRVQRLPQQSPHPLFDLLHAAQPVVIRTRKGERVPGVVAGLSTHLQSGRQNAPRGAHPDEMYLDMGASSPAEVRAAGVDLLDPVALDRTLYQMGFGKLTGVAVGDRFGCAALVELLSRIEPAKLRGTLTVAFVAQQWAGARGLDRLTQHIKADEMIYVGRLLPHRVARGTEAQPSVPRKAPGNGVLIGFAEPEAPLTGLAAELRRLGEENKIKVDTDFSGPLPRVSFTQGPSLPPRFAHLSIPIAWPVTPAEVIASADLENLVALLEVYAQGSVRPPQPSGYTNWMRAPPVRPYGAPPVTEILKDLVETYGASGHEGPVREAITRLLPPWAKAETDAAGNLILRLASAPRGSKALRIAFIAHMDEIGYQVRSIADDGRLVVQALGGFIPEFFLGHAVLVHAAGVSRPGVLELPPGWDAPGFEWPRGALSASRMPSREQQAGEAATWRVDVGAHTAAEVEQLGIKVGDPLTIPKKYRRLLGTRVNGRSFDDRVGCAALLAVAWALGPNLPGRDVTLIWSTEEEVGLRGALAAADRLAASGEAPDYVFAVDTFASADSPLESKRFADAPLGKGFVIRAVDNSNITSREWVDHLVKLARANGIAVQYGVTGGGNDGAAFLRHGSANVPIAWPLRYSHSPGEVIDTQDLEALARIVAAIARSW